MSKILLVTLNAKFIHSSLALWSLRANCGVDCEILELTTNHRREQILAQVYRRKPDVLGISCYIWNTDQLLEMADELKKVLPGVIIIAGGPEVAYCPGNVLRNHSVDVVVTGEGETAFAQLAENLQDFRSVAGIAFIENGNIVRTQAVREDMNSLNFAYAHGFDGLDNKIIYYESSRGCPYSCAYCLSALSAGVRRLESAYRHLDAFLVHKPPQVKFVDRTFNANKSYAMDIWRYLIAHDNGVTNFHFEISGGLLDEETIALLAEARPGLFQFEIGVQTTNTFTLAAINRPDDLDLIFANCRALMRSPNIHIHLDLIAGLPCEDFLSFRNSFNSVYSLAPQQLQMGFLKLLKGSHLRDNAAKYEIKYCSHAPYEVLETAWLGFDELLELKQIAEVLEVYYNSGQFRSSVKYLIQFYDSPFDFYYALAKFRGDSLNARGKAQTFGDLFQFGAGVCGDAEKLRGFLRFDLCLNEHPRALPDMLRSEIVPELKKKLASKRADIGVERFSYTIDDWLNGGVLAEEEVYLRFDYSRPDPVMPGVNCTFGRVCI